MEYTYYSLYRPVDIGTYPKNPVKPLKFVNFEGRMDTGKGFEAWGYLVYPELLSDEQARNYELKLAD